MQNCCIKWLWVIVEQSCITLECITKITKVTKQLWSSSNITLYVRNWWFWASQNNNNFAENILKSAGSITKGINIEYEIHHHLGQPRRNEIISHNSNNASKLAYLIFTICDMRSEEFTIGELYNFLSMLQDDATGLMPNSWLWLNIEKSHLQIYQSKEQRAKTTWVHNYEKYSIVSNADYEYNIINIV